ncbi:MAG: DNA replication/repair protein RecF [Piscirickettsiaceae bacterium]|nr:DNA replication/repair protein RecF [Piscirickettsiaceae bacterium]
MISQLTISNLRNITDISIQPESGINLILGDNGSGKTSILEAVHLLGLGRSFRTRSLKNAVQFKQQQFQVVAKTETNIPVGLQFNLNTGLQIRLNNAPLKKLSELATQLPMQMIPANCHQFFEQGPRYRRQLVDWGLFHVEPEFNYQWQSYKKILQQRNSAIRQRKKSDEIQLWDTHLASFGEKITAHRQQQLSQLLTSFEVIFTRICPEYSDAEFSIRYKNGWAKDRNLAESLQLSLERDQKLGYTRSGSHAADWSFRINDVDPAELFSRGQQKLFVLALCMAQAKITEQTRHERSLLLLDDISSELDIRHQQLVLNELALLPVQAFITSTDLALKEAETSVFHVKHGAIYSGQ